MENIMQDLRDLRNHHLLRHEQFDTIIDKIDDKQTHLKNLIDMVEDPTQVYRCEDKNPDGETLDIVIDQLKLIINKIK